MFFIHTCTCTCIKDVTTGPSYFRIFYFVSHEGIGILLPGLMRMPMLAPGFLHFNSPHTLPTDKLFNLEFQFESVFNLEFQPKFGI